MGNKQEEEERPGWGTGEGLPGDTSHWGCSRSGWTTMSCMLHMELNIGFMNELL